MNSDLAPIILFIYNRPDHTRRTLQALKQNIYAKDSIVHVFADGPKENASVDDLAKITQARSVISEEQWCKKVILVNRETNMNLEDNVIDGITRIINKYGKAIILEDDIVTAPHFLQYCNEGLKLYENTKHIFSINGFMFPIDFGGNVESFLCPIASSWGWATWADRWNQFERDPVYISEIENNEFLTSRYNIANFDHVNMLKNMKTWDTRWYYTAFIRNGLGLFPTKSLVYNIGFDGSGTHGGYENLKQEIHVSNIPLVFNTYIEMKNYSKLLEYCKVDTTPNSITRRIKKRIKNFLSKMN